MVQQILDFASAGSIERQPVDLEEFAGTVLGVLRRTIPESVSISLKTEVVDDNDLGLGQRASALTVWADPGRLQQVMTNLALNARDAMPDGGELRFEVCRLKVQGGDPLATEVGIGTWVRLTVSDTGTGMTQEVQAHLFEPFFTTKGKGEGTGLGLAQVYGIVRQHGGSIDVASAPGQGTTFHIYLPTCDGQVEEDQHDSAASPMPRGQGETILFVEDDERLREATANTLQSLGYRVLVAANGREALGIFETDGDVDLVVTDVVMPHMGGKALMRELLDRDPDIKAVGITGYVLDDSTEPLQDHGFLRVVHKPFNVENLARAVWEVLQ